MQHIYVRSISIIFICILLYIDIIVWFVGLQGPLCYYDNNLVLNFQKLTKILPTGQRLVRAPVTLWVTVSEKMELDVT